jgi:MtN3 and saliva related transmembrane protein
VCERVERFGARNHEAMMDQAFINVVGTLAATLTTVCWLPQALHIIRTRDATAVSLLTYSIFAVGLVLWLCYGLLLGSWPIIGSNLVTLPPVLVIIALKLRHG